MKTLFMNAKWDELLPVIEKIANIGIYDTDLSNGTWTGSENFIRLFGLQKKEQYTVQEFQALVHPEDFEEVMAYFRLCLEQKKDFDYEYRCVKGNGDVIYVSSRSKVYYSAEGTPLRVLGVKQDITIRHQTELVLKALNENNQKKNDILGVVAHDLRAPIAQLEGVVEILKSVIGPEHQDLIGLPRQIFANIDSLTKEIIEIAELEEKAYNLEIESIDINKLVNECIARYESIAVEKNIQIVRSFAHRCMSKVSPQKLSRAVDNLISNALKFTPDGRWIEITTQISDNCLILKIKDHGIGIKKENIPHLFGKFSRAVRRPGLKGERSTGLGLSIVKQIIDLHHGTIDVQSETNEGTTFVIKIPTSLSI